MVERNGIFRLFRFSGILGQRREVHPNFRNEIPEKMSAVKRVLSRLTAVK